MTESFTLGDGWRRLWRHSYRLGMRWLVRDARSAWRAGRTGWVRFLVPLDPWRYYELGRIADQSFTGRCLDVSSPKLLPSLLQHEGRGTWLGTDLFSREIASWKRVDPKLPLEVQDATALEYDDETFDVVVCISVLEHIGHDKDAVALAEMWRVLRPGGVLHLTTDVAVEPRDVLIDRPVYGEASSGQKDSIFFKRDYAPHEVDDMVAQHSWTLTLREFVVQRDPGLEERFYRWAPWSYAFGPLLRWRCPRNFRVSLSPDLLSGSHHGVVYLQLVKSLPGEAA